METWQKIVLSIIVVFVILILVGVAMAALSSEFGVYRIMVPKNMTITQEIFFDAIIGSIGTYKSHILNDTIALIYPVAFKIDGDKLYAGSEDNMIKIKDSVAVLEDTKDSTLQIIIKDNDILELEAISKTGDGTFSLELKRVMDLVDLFSDDPCNGRLYQVKTLRDGPEGAALYGDGAPFPAIVRYCKDDQTIGLMKVDGTYHTEKIINGQADFSDILPTGSDMDDLKLFVDPNGRIYFGSTEDGKFVELVDVVTG